MYLNWIPQNIQKRVFLYILQQLSLFSGIELPNLEEVSFNNIHLRDVAIDPDKITQIPGLRLRHGLLRSVALKGSVKEGAHLEICGVDLVVAPSIDSLRQDIENAHALLAQSSADLTQTILLDAAVSPDISVSNLGDTTPVSVPGADTIPPPATNLPMFPGSMPAACDPAAASADPLKRPSSLSGVMSKAIDIALLKLQVRVTNITVKIVIEPADLVIKIDEIVFSYKTGSKIVSVKGIAVFADTPFSEAGMRGRTSGFESDAKASSGCETSGTFPCGDPDHSQSGAEGEESDESDESNESDENEHAEESLMDSMIFTHDEASSIYMSAASQSFVKSAENPSPAAEDSSDLVCLFHIDCANILFENVSPLSNLRIDIQDIKVAAVPLLPTLSVILASLSKLLKLSIHQLKKRNSFEKSTGRVLNCHQNDPAPGASFAGEDTGLSLLVSFHVKSFDISLTSALNKQGTFESFENEVNVVFANFSVRFKNENLFYGGLETFEILRFNKGEKSHVFRFSDQDKPKSTSPSQQENINSESSAKPKKADIRFEYSVGSNNSEPLKTELTILVSKPGTFELDAQSLKYILNFVQCLLAVNKTLSILRRNIQQFEEILGPRLAAIPKSRTDTQISSQIVLQTSSIEAKLALSAFSMLKLLVLPISYNKKMDHILIPRISVDLLKNKTKTQILNIMDILGHFSIQKFESYHFSVSSSAPKKNFFKTSISISVGSMNGTMTREMLSCILDDTKEFLVILKNADSVNSFKAAFTDEFGSEKSHLFKAGNVISSVYSQQNRYRRMNNTQIMFGDVQSSTLSLKISLNLIHFVLTDISEMFGGLSLQADGVELLHSNTGVLGHVSSLLIERTSNEEAFLSRPICSNQFPMIQFRQKGIERLAFEMVWRGFLVNYHVNWVKLLRASSNQKSPPPNNATENARIDSETHIRITFHDFAVGMIPGRLQSQLCVTGINGSLDISIKKEQFSMKSSIRDLRMLLIDKMTSLPQQTNHPKSTIYSAFIDVGYIDIGSINLIHVGISIEKDSFDTKFQQTNDTSEPSEVGLKINIDQVCLAACADSTHTLLQVVSDLKEPVVFKDNEKYRTRVETDFLMPTTIFEEVQLNKLKTSSEAEKKISTRSDNDDFFVIDENYSEHHSTENILKTLSDMDINSPFSTSKNCSPLQVVDTHFIEKEYAPRVSVLPFLMFLNVKLLNIYLHDGYDWKLTRKSIKSAVKELEKQSRDIASDMFEKELNNRRGSSDIEGEYESKSTRHNHSEENKNIQELQEFMLKQTLFQSIHIETDKTMGTSDLVEIINAQVRGDNISAKPENGAHTNVKVDKNFKDLKLKRSQRHKVSAEVQNINVKAKNFDNTLCGDKLLKHVSQSKVMNSLEVELDSIDVTDNVQSSTWNTMLTYLNALGEREIGKSMLELRITSVRPDSRMLFAETIVDLKVLPLRLFIDQDTLGFVTRYFGFRDSRFALPVDETPFFQKLTIDPVHVKFDYKPKSIDYAGIRSGNNAELANLFILDGSDLKLKRAVVYGAHGFPKLGKGLAQIYGPYIQKCQLSGLLSGIPPVKSFLNVGNGVRDLISLPIKEYKRDGRVLYGLQKGSVSFAKVTANELLKFGVKLASGAQVALENLEEYFGGEGALARGPLRKSSNQRLKPIKLKSDKRANLLESSQMLRNSIIHDPEQYLKPIQYIHSAIDEEDLEPEMGKLQSSILVFDGESEEDDSEDYLSEDSERKITSLYSSQPANAKEGLKLAVKAMKHNLKGSRKKLGELNRELKNADTLQEQVISLAKNSPVIVIRPFIGGTEAVMKTLMGISNGIDSRALQESHDKYGTEKEDE